MKHKTAKSRNVCITAADGHLGYLIAELILENHEFESQVDSVSVLTLHPNSASIKNLGELGANIATHKLGHVGPMIETLEEAGCDTICIIPPAHREKYNITAELIDATKKANVPNMLFISSAGVDMAERTKQPHLHELIDLECLVMAPYGDGKNSSVIVRAGFYAENLLLYAPSAQTDGILPIPILTSSVLAPIALADIALVGAHILTGRGPGGFSDAHAGQLMTLTGPKLYTGSELASLVSSTFSNPTVFKSISEREAQKVLKAQGDTDPSELQYLLEYYRLVRDGKCNYVATTAFVNIVGVQPQEAEEFFTLYAESVGGASTSEEIQRGLEEIEDDAEDGNEMQGKRRLKKKRKLWPGEGKMVMGNVMGKWKEWK